MELRRFLIKAKKATYANANVEKVTASRRGSNDYEYSDDGMTYHDTHYYTRIPLWRLHAGDLSDEIIELD